MHKKIAEMIATVFYIGKIPIAPGTFGSVVAFPVCYIIMNFVITNKIIFTFREFDLEYNLSCSILCIELLVIILLLIIGTIATKIYISGNVEQDPKEVVIDELVGQMLTIVFCSFSILLINSTKLEHLFSRNMIDITLIVILPFILFRFFDIQKPWPINYCDQHIKGAFGVMLDDLLAAIFAIVTHYVIIFLIIDFFL